MGLEAFNGIHNGTDVNKALAAPATEVRAIPIKIAILMSHSCGINVQSVQINRRTVFNSVMEPSAETKIASL
jgi:hypothetical protein